MAILHAIFLGIIEGLTEFLPISSTGHILIAEKLIKYKDTAEIFTVVIQVGAIAAVIWYYRRELIEKVTKLFSRDKNTIFFWRNWIAATIPAGIAGLLAGKSLDKVATLPVIATALILGGIAIILIENKVKSKAADEPKLNKLSLKQAITVGCYQVLSLVPGVSRSGATIMGGLLTGLDRVTATAFSFFLSLPILILASGYKLVSDRDKLSTVEGGGMAILVGTIAAFITGFIAINWLIKYVSKNDFKPFAYYRIVLGILIIAGLIIS